MDNSAILILTHGRADRVYTWQTLRDLNYKGKIYLVLDDEDEQISEYQKNYGKENVIVFNKKQAVENTDDADIFDDKRAVVYARNKTFDIAESLGLKYFLVLDDDYDRFCFRFEENHTLKQKPIEDLNPIFDAFYDFLDESGALTVAFSQGGDFVGGSNSSTWKKRLPRKAMNAFFCKTDRPFKFYGKINEDVNMYVLNGIRGNLVFTYAPVMLDQQDTQSNAGGLTDIYLNLGTFIKSFYSVMYAPSCVKLAGMGNKFKRIHHLIEWENCTPMILNERWKKKA